MKIYNNLTNAEYRAKKDFLSASDIKTLLENPYAFKNEFQKAKTDNMTLGSLIHTLILEPNNLQRDYLVIDEVLNLRTNEGKAKKAEYESKAEAENKELITSDTLNKALEIAESFKKSPIYNLFNENGVAELSIFGKIDEMPCKCRPDYFIKDKNIILDLKTTNTQGGASADGFIKAVANFKYYIQAAFYLELTQAKEFYFVVIETNAPYMSGVYKLDVVSLEFGLKEVKRALNIYKELDKFKSNVYLDIENDFKVVQELTLPNYVYYQKGASI